MQKKAWKVTLCKQIAMLCIDLMQLRAYLCIHALTIKSIQYIFVVRVANVWYDILLFASFYIAILSLRYILLTSVYYFYVTVLYSLMRWISGEILNSLDTRKPKTPFCQYYRGYQTYPYLSNVLWCLKTIKMLYEVSKGCGYRLLQNYSRCSCYSKWRLEISFLRVFK